MEKPLARNVAEAEEIISAAKHHSMKLMVGYPLRFNDAFVKVKQEIDNGLLGDVEVAYATYIGSGPFFHRAEGYAPVPVPDWWFKKELTGGGAMVDLGSHMINLFRWYFGEVKDVQSHMGYRLNMDFEDTAICMIRFRSGTLGIVSVGWFSQDYTLKADLFGSVKHRSVQHHPPNFLATAAQMLTLGTSKYYLPHLAELQHFTNCIVNDRNPSPTGQDGLKDIEAITKAYQNQIQLN
jgi:predicted dehydrogenase